jgi:hypothetical protein
MVAAETTKLKHGPHHTAEYVGQARAGEIMDVGLSTVNHANRIFREGATEDIALVKSGEKTVGEVARKMNAGLSKSSFEIAGDSSAAAGRWSNHGGTNPISDVVWNSAALIPPGAPILFRLPGSSIQRHQPVDRRNQGRGCSVNA